jgi:hypothetical protein
VADRTTIATGPTANSRTLLFFCKNDKKKMEKKRDAMMHTKAMLVAKDGKR